MTPFVDMRRLLAVLGAFGCAWILFVRVPAMKKLASSGGLYFSQTSLRLEVAANHVTRLDMLPPRVSTVCEFLNNQGITEYFVDDSVYQGSGPAKHRMMEGCWPKRQNAHAADVFIDESKEAGFMKCARQPLADGVIHVTCER